MADERDVKRPIPDVLAILPLRGTVLFPHAVVPLSAGRASSIRLIEETMQAGRLIGAVTQKDPADEAPTLEGLHCVGTVAMVHKVLKQSDGTMRVVVQGIGRFRLDELVQASPFLRARIQEVVEPEEAPDVELEALGRSVQSLFEKVVALSPNLPDELATVIAGADAPATLVDLIAASLPLLPLDFKQDLLETVSVRERLSKLIGALGKEVEVLELGSKIQSEIQSEVSKTQREYYLREQMKAIQKELGDGDERTQEIDELRAKIEAAGMPEEARREAFRELDRLAKMPPAAAEHTVVRTYIDWLVTMPWQISTTDAHDLDRARDVLDEDHEGLDKIKERILEYLAVRKMKPDGKDPIICFVGPPGVGKTSLGRSIARALGRKFHRISLGGIRDEAEIRGHRRTYVGALPGQIVQGLRRAGSRNPVFMLDEIDKLGMDFRGDPASALLEVLDPEQNTTFRDHYLDVPFDLSRVLFITTANVIDAVPAPLRDRMEVIHLAGYTEDEKRRIAERHLVPKQASEHGLVAGTDVTFTPEALRLLARSYTREAGVRNLEREIASVCRKIARRHADDRTEPVTVTPDLVLAFLGVPRFEFEELEERTSIPGVAVGLACWSRVDASGRRRAVRRSDAYARQGRAHTDRSARRCDEGVRADGALVGAVARGPARHRGRLLRAQRRARTRTGGSDTEGWPVGRRHDADGAGVAPDRRARAERSGDDRRDQPVRPGSAGRRYQGEDTGGPPRGYPHGAPASAKRKESDRGRADGGPGRDDLPSGGVGRGGRPARAGAIDRRCERSTNRLCEVTL
jgi:ATP-dependent Lon protease